MRLHTAAEMYARQERLRAALAERRARPRVTASSELSALKQSARKGVQVVAVPQLFETPPDLARRVVQFAGIEPAHAVLEPSAGTGRLLRELPASCRVVAVELNHELATALRAGFPSVDVRCADFLEVGPSLGSFDRVIMNPPFAGAADIAHVQAARRLLVPGGRLVAIVAGGPRQESALRAEAEHWERLPSGTFAGTAVVAALAVFAV